MPKFEVYTTMAKFEIWRDVYEQQTEVIGSFNDKILYAHFFHRLNDIVRMKNYGGIHAGTVF